MNTLLTVAAVFAAILVLGACAPEPDMLQRGGFQDADKDDAEVQQLARFAVSEIGNEYGLVEVTKAEIAMVAGRMFRLKLTVNRIRETDGEVQNLSCKVKVHTQDWIGLIELVDYKCIKMEASATAGDASGVEITGV